MMYALETALSPVVWLMKLVLDFYISLLSSTGISILLTSFTFSLLLLPLQKIANRTEHRISEKTKKVAAEVKSLSASIKGEELFLATERIYKANGYHPIQSIGLGASFLVMLPVLISAILLFNGSGILTGESFLFVKDLSRPDGFLGPVNLLPFIMSAITWIDATLRFSNDRKSRQRFFFISVVLLVIVYNLASGLVLYWIGSNTMSLALSQLKSQ
jgi:membrane protein insertase Oxa1/YidC/SpoIIIJ